jgi:DNA-binding CsgD family transcriptional regulator
MRSAREVLAMTSPAQKEVAAVMFKVLLNAGKRSDISAERLVRNAQFKHDLLADGRRRYPWTDYVAVLEELASALGGYERLGHEAALVAQFVPKEVVALFRIFVSPSAVYHFIYNVLDPLVLPMCRNSCASLDDGKLRVEWEIDQGYVESVAFAWASLGGIEGIPGYIGLGRSRVEALEFGPRRATCIVTPPPSRTLLARAFPPEPVFTRAVLSELGEEHELALTHSSLMVTVTQLEEQNSTLAQEIEQRENTELTLSRVLGTTVGPAFFVRAGDVLPGNERGRLALSTEGTELRRAILAAVAAPHADGEFEVMASGRRTEFLVIQRGPAAEIERKVHVAVQRWQLTPRQQTVLRALLKGQTNAEMAAALGCAERTVETHISALLQRADAGSRLALVAAFWSDL